MSLALYKEQILDHYRNPRNFGRLENANIKNREVNTLCGDEIEMQLKLNSNKVEEVKFIGNGCAISLASASMLTEIVKGKSLEELKNIEKEDILNLLNIEISTVRLKCALLSLDALKNGILNYEVKK